ncbi:hypothetical protein QBC33DRAFT_559077 [Phialemonium atrogriseum]|uniref:F-box domain-containing protein n=1 Tax=Phialemonium atrogriseum TaxID=1093897 RepID=A0AAJ0FLP8_9PEZI|nr:uncharacterized protein QBC33DRAFT_559077 [Phialemonium atrogriseum]KAK1767593.1 hypothetical protein QBC33DRAFT_559077 [Phialemonium atrogriseum]
MSLPGHKSQSTSQLNLVHLPAELFAAAASHLPNRDIKNLRLTCKILRERATLGLDRVFLSANPRNVEVFHAIADHETLRKGIIEIIWDDSQLVHNIERENDAVHRLMESPSPEACPGWFARACQQNIDYLASRKESDVDRPDHVARTEQIGAQLPLDVSWDYYQQLLLQQEDVLASGADIYALRYGLDRFPSLRRITITPAAHGFLFTPLYETPMIRAFPYGFNYPTPRGWPTPDFGEVPYEAPPRDDETEKSKWRGFCIVTRKLEKQNHHISELILDVNQLNTGLNCHVFDQPCEEYDNLVVLLRRPGFHRIDFALLADGQEWEDWSSFLSGYLKLALGEAKDLQHVSLRTQVDVNQFYEATLSGTSESTENFIPLRTIFPIDRWQKLRHFGLSNFLVRQDNLLSLLAALPTSLRSIKLSFLTFLGDGGNYRDLLADMRNALGWRDRPANERPRVTILVGTQNTASTRALCMDGEVNEFL